MTIVDMTEAAHAIPVDRQHQRLLALVFVAWSQGGRSGSWSTHDLSMGGLSIRGSVPDANQPVLLRIRVGTESVHLRARQQWTRQAHDGAEISGLRFDALDVSQAANLEVLMEHLRGMAAEAPEPPQWPPAYPEEEPLDAATTGILWLVGAAAVSAFAAAAVLFMLP